MRVLIAIALLFSAAAQAESTLIYNVNGSTMLDGERQRFTALEYDNGKVVAVYGNAQAAQASAAERRIDGQGATMLPGLIDAHGHVEGYGKALSNVDLNGSTSEFEAAQRVAAFIASSDAKPAGSRVAAGTRCSGLAKRFPTEPHSTP